MKVVFAILLVVEIVALLAAARVVPRFAYPNEAVLVVAVNSVLLVLVAKRLKKKPACCS